MKLKSDFNSCVSKRRKRLSWIEKEWLELELLCSCWAQESFLLGTGSQVGFVLWEWGPWSGTGCEGLEAELLGQEQVEMGSLVRGSGGVWTALEQGMLDIPLERRKW